MEIRFTFAQEDAAVLEVGIAGSRMVLSGLASGRRITLDGALADISFAVLPASEDTAVAEARTEVIQAQADIEAVPAHTAEPSTSGEDAFPVLEAAPYSALDAEASQEVFTLDRPDIGLFEQLVALRKQIASEVRLPPYIIFHDSTLRQMCMHLPTDREAMGGIQGIGQSKLEKYGMRFVEAIRQYAAAHPGEGDSSDEGAA